MMMKHVLQTALLLVFTASCSPKAAKLYPKPFLPPTKVIDGDNTQYFDPKADILFVIDNSASMGVHQRNLANNISQFTKVFLQNSVLDYNIGVVSTDMDRPDPIWGSSKICCGALNGNPTFVTKTTPSADAALQRNIMIGTSGSGEERSFDPVIAALSPPEVNGGNRGFYRQDAALIVVFITDAEDQSRATPQQLYDFLLGLKNGDKEKVLGFGAIIPTGVSGCERDPGGTPVRIEQLLGMMPNPGANFVSLCDVDFGKKIADFASQIVAKVASIIYLTRPPKLETIRVIYGNAELPQDEKTGWVFDPARNAILLGKEIDWASQPPGSKVSVFYDAAKFDEN